MTNKKKNELKEEMMQLIKLPTCNIESLRFFLLGKKVKEKELEEILDEFFEELDETTNKFLVLQKYYNVQRCVDVYRDCKMNNDLRGQLMAIEQLNKMIDKKISANIAKTDTELKIELT